MSVMFVVWMGVGRRPVGVMPWRYGEPPVARVMPIGDFPGTCRSWRSRS